MTTTSILTRLPQNTSFLQPTKFLFTFPTLPFLTYFCQSVTLPTISTSPVPIETPFSNTFRHGDKLVYDSMRLTALIDEDIRTWEETYNWLVALTFPKEFQQYIRYFNQDKSPYHDAVLTINTNANIQNVRVLFKDCHPVSLSGITFNSTSSAEQVITADIEFRYDTFEISRL